jgi:hypothetical protein
MAYYERHRERNRSLAEVTVWAALLSVLLAPLAATSGCSTQSPASTRQSNNEVLAGPGEFILTPEGRVVIIKQRSLASSR